MIHRAILEGLGSSNTANAGHTFVVTWLVDRVCFEKGSLTVEVCALNKCQDKFSGKVFGRLEVIPCEVRTFRALLQDENQLSVRHVDDLAVPRHVLDFLQDLHGSTSYWINFFSAHIWADLGNPVSHLPLHFFFTLANWGGVFTTQHFVASVQFRQIKELITFIRNYMKTQFILDDRSLKRDIERL